MAPPWANLESVPPTLQADELVLVRGSLRVEITLRPLAFTVRRSGRRLLRAAGLWAAEGKIADRLIHLTEGVVANEVRSPRERAVIGQIDQQGEGWLRLAVVLSGGRRASLGIELTDSDWLTFEFDAADDPLRLAMDWDRRSDERPAALGLRHATVELYRAYVMLHEQLVPYVRATARASATGVPIIRPLCLIDPADPRGWEITDGCARAARADPDLGALRRDRGHSPARCRAPWSGRSARARAPAGGDAVG